MSTQGFAAAFEGLNKGLLSGLDIARQQAQQKLQEQEAQRRKEEANQAAMLNKANLAARGIAGVDNQGNPIMVSGFAKPGESYADALTRREKEKDYITIPEEWSVKRPEQTAQNIGRGATALGEGSGLGSLVETGGAPKGLEGLAPLAGKAVDPKLLSVYSTLSKKEMGSDVLSGRPDIAMAVSQQRPLNAEQVQYLSKTPEGRSIFGAAQSAVNQAAIQSRADRNFDRQIGLDERKFTEETRKANAMSPQATRTVGALKTLKTNVQDIVQQAASDKVQTGFRLGASDVTGLANGSGIVGGALQALGREFGATTPEERQFLKSYQKQVLDTVKANAGTTFTDKFVGQINKMMPSLSAPKEEFLSQMQKIVDMIDQEAANTIDVEISAKGGNPQDAFQSVWAGKGNIPGARAKNPNRPGVLKNKAPKSKYDNMSDAELAALHSKVVGK